MAEGKYKQFIIDSEDRACVSLLELVTAVMKNLDKYNEYIEEAIDYFNDCKKELIPEKDYASINDRLLFRQRELLKYVADYQDSSFSYINLRKILIKKGYLKRELPKEVEKLLLELLDIRNWSFHNPQSLMVARDEAIMKGVPEEFRGMVEVHYQLNPVMIEKVIAYDRVMYGTMIEHALEKSLEFSTVLDEMQEDYRAMYAAREDKSFVVGYDPDEIVYYEQERIIRYSDLSNDVAQISMAIQKSKYDGTNETYNKWSLRKNGL